MWASSEANAALRDIVMRFAEFEILVVKLLQGYMKKVVQDFILVRVTVTLAVMVCVKFDLQNF